ncbi:hypothetical protein [Flavobacterium sp. GCM10023249]|uniref:hypothetical protein n=1 Tax=unclassified Flavobacterium TaxID=196869 RepID=UPI003621BB8C
MDLYDRILRIVDINIIYCLFPLLLTLVLIEVFFKNRFKTKEVINFIRWFVIVYTIVTLLFYVYRLIVTTEESAFLTRATGPYWFSYWLMLFCSTLLPLSLLFERLATKRIYLLFVFLLIKVGVLLEFFTIAMVSFHRDYLSEHANYDWWNSPLGIILLCFAQGFLLALVLLGVFELVEKVKLRHSSAE